MHPLVDELLVLLRRHPLVRIIRVVTLDETPSGRLEVKLRCQLTGAYQLQIWLHREPAGLDYAFQLFTQQPVLRWDNAPHYPAIATAPHHFHDERGAVGVSPLSGEPLADLEILLHIVEMWLRPKG